MRIAHEQREKEEREQREADEKARREQEEADRKAREQEAQQHHDDDTPKPTDTDAAIKEALDRAAREREEAARQAAAQKADDDAQAERDRAAREQAIKDKAKAAAADTPPPAGLSIAYLTWYINDWASHSSGAFTPFIHSLATAVQSGLNYKHLLLYWYSFFFDIRSKNFWALAIINQIKHSLSMWRSRIINYQQFIKTNIKFI